MAFNNIIPASIINDMLEEIHKEPKQLHFDKDVFFACFYINEEALDSCNEAFTWITPNGHGPNGTISKSVDHPAFAALRRHLNTHGYIEMQTGWVNGDRVRKPFYLNDVFFDVNDKFLSASAMKWKIKNRKKRHDI
jgi:hypothetical protein